MARPNEIHKQFKQYDVKIAKLKHDSGNQKLNGIVCKPRGSKQAVIEQVFTTLYGFQSILY